MRKTLIMIVASLALVACNDESPAFRSCAEAEKAGATPVRKGDPGYSTRIDTDKDGVACE